MQALLTTCRNAIHPTRACWPFAGLVVATLLAACGGGGDTSLPPAEPPPTTLGKSLGTVEIDITGLGSAKLGSEMRWNGETPQRRALAVARSGVAATPDATAAATTNLPSGLDIRFQSASSIDSGGMRYISVTYQVRNAQFSANPGNGTAYDVARNNLTFMAVVPSTGINGSAITRFVRFDNSPANPALALQLIPTHGMNSMATAVEAARASMQVYRETELPAADASVTDVLPYGFVVHNVNDGSRTLPASPSAGQFDGLVTFAFKLPVQANPTDNPFKISLRFQVMEDSNTRVTQSLEDTGPAAAARAARLGSSDLVVLCDKVANVASSNPICRVRLAGPVGSPTAYISTVAPTGTPQVVASPGGLSGLAPTADIALAVNQDMAPPTAQTLLVHGSMSGQRTVSGAFAGLIDGGSGSSRPNQLVFKLGPTDKPFFRGETVSFVATAANASTGGQSLPAFAGSYHVQGSAAATANWTGGQAYLTAPGTRSTLVGDLNADGRPDVVAINSTGNSITVLLASPSGGFAAPVSHAGITAPSAAAIGDVNGDGKLDVLVAANGANVLVLLGDGAGGLSQAATVATTYAANFMLLTDMNGDGKLDLAGVNTAGRYLILLLNDGLGGLSSLTPLSLAAGNPTSLAAADTDGDGTTDLAVGYSTGTIVSLLFGDGAGGIDSERRFTTRTAPTSVALGDLDGDGKIDLAVANRGSSNVSVLLGDGLGGLGTQALYSVGTGNTPTALNLIDTNGDGKLDVVLLAAGSGAVAVMQGDGLGGLGAPSFAALGSNPQHVSVGDFDGDGKQDVVAALSSGLVSVLKGNGSGGFLATATVSAGASPSFLTVGDLNGDGRLDMVTVSNGVPALNVRLGDGLGGFVAAPDVSLPAGAAGLALGDLNGDGRLDLVYTSTATSVVYVLLGNGTGGFAAPVAHGLPAGASGVALGDFDANGKLDVVVVVVGTTNTVSILLGQGDGTLLPATSVTVGSEPRAVAVGDFNGDGRLDLAVVNSSARTVSVLLGNNTGLFPTSVTLTGLGQIASSIAVGDIDGDGRQDLVVTNSGGSPHLSTFLGNGVGGFGPATSRSLGSSPPSSVMLADLNGDGALDIVCSTGAASTVGVLMSNGAGDFDLKLMVSGGSNTTHVAVGDFNGDGKLDVLAANRSSANVGVILAQ